MRPKIPSKNEIIKNKFQKEKKLKDKNKIVLTKSKTIINAFDREFCSH